MSRPDLIEYLIGEENGFSRSPKKFDKIKHEEMFLKEFESTTQFPPNFQELYFDQNKPDGAWELSYLTASKHFKKPLSEFHFKSQFYNFSLLEYLKENSFCVFRHIYQESPDSSFLFFYKNIFICVGVNSKDEDGSLYINSIVAYSTVETPIPIRDFEPFRKPPEPEKSKIGIIKSGRGGMYVSKLDLKHSYEFNLQHYNEDFEEFNNNIVKLLEEKKPGLFLFHGDPGTGKSSAIRHLVDTVKRNFIFVPPQMISQLSSPEFADIVTDTHKGSVLVLEDAEKALMKRESEDGFSNSTLVSSILNLTDGLYADLGQLAIIATYNCDRNLIDKALLRKGRMKAEYKFNKLSTTRSQALMDKLGYSVKVEEPMTLADIFNYEEQYSNNPQEEKKPMGFGFRS